MTDFFKNLLNRLFGRGAKIKPRAQVDARTMADTLAMQKDRYKKFYRQEEGE